jgi:cell wall assembly regulator SMI1
VPIPSRASFVSRNITWVGARAGRLLVAQTSAEYLSRLATEMWGFRWLVRARFSPN